jgi:VanZ family protein
MSSTRHLKTGFRLLLVLALVATTWASLTPDPIPLPDGPQMDKWAHLAAYVVLAMLVDFSWPDREFDLPKWAGLLGYGIAIELIQSQVPNRMLSIADLAANTVGIALYAFLILRTLRTLGLRKPHLM